METKPVFCAVCGHGGGERFVRVILEDHDLWLCTAHAQQLEGRPRTLAQLASCFGAVGLERRSPKSSQVPPDLDRRRYKEFGDCCPV